MDAAWLLSVATFALSTAGTPGPNNTMVMASGATWGFARTLPHMAGITIGFAVMVMVLSFGGHAIVTDPTVQLVLKWVGVAYLLYLAWKIAMAAPKPPAEGAGAQAVARESRPFSFLQAAAFQWVNPKAWIIAAGAVATFALDVGTDMLPTVLAMTAIFMAATAPAVAGWTLLGVGAARFLRSPAALRRFNIFMAVLLVLSLIPVIFPHE